MFAPVASAFTTTTPARPDFAIFRGPNAAGGEFQTFGAFVEDVVRIGDSVTLSLGLRFDHSRAVSQDLAEIDADGNETGGTIEGLGTL